MLKVFTSACILAGVALFLAWPWFLRSHPDIHAPLTQRRAYAETFLVYNGAILLAFVGAGVGALLILRNARRTYREEAILNLRELVEGSLEAHSSSGREVDG